MRIFTNKRMGMRRDRPRGGAVHGVLRARKASSIREQGSRRKGVHGLSPRVSSRNDSPCSAPHRFAGTYIFNKYIDELVSFYADNHKEYNIVSAEILSDYNITWKGRNLYLEIELDVVKNYGNQDTVIGEFAGKRIWIEKYSWKER